MSVAFAKLFEKEGVGQILVTIGQNDEGRAACIFRIPDECDCEVTMALVRPEIEGEEDEAADEQFARFCFEGATDAIILEAIKPLIFARDALRAQDKAMAGQPF